MNSRMKRHRGRGPEGSQAQEILSPWSWGATFLARRCVPRPAGSLNPTLLGFYGGFITEA